MTLYKWYNGFRLFFFLISKNVTEHQVIHLQKSTASSSLYFRNIWLLGPVQIQRNGNGNIEQT